MSHQLLADLAIGAVACGCALLTGWTYSNFSKLIDLDIWRKEEVDPLLDKIGPAEGPNLLHLLAERVNAVETKSLDSVNHRIEQTVESSLNEHRGAFESNLLEIRSTVAHCEEIVTTFNRRLINEEIASQSLAACDSRLIDRLALLEAAERERERRRGKDGRFQKVNQSVPKS